MIKHFPSATAELDVHPADERHVGEMVNRWRHCYVNGLLEIGFSDFSGEMRMPGSSGYHGMVVITAGTGEVREGGIVAEFQVGDVFVFEPPVGETEIISPKGCKYVYMTRWESDAARSRFFD